VEFLADHGGLHLAAPAISSYPLAADHRTEGHTELHLAAPCQQVTPTPDRFTPPAPHRMTTPTSSQDSPAAAPAAANKQAPPAAGGKKAQAAPKSAPKPV
jgi:hypothetical protein